MKYDVTGSIVLYNNNPDEVRKAIRSFLNTGLSVKLYLIDNSPARDLAVLRDDERIEYVFNTKNLGYGKAHNIALRSSISSSAYHLILNPDVVFESNALRSLVKTMEEDEQLGLVIPKVLNFDLKTQFVCKRLPVPIDLIIRRVHLTFLTRMFQKRLLRYEMRDKDYDKPFEAPYLSGCFMLLRTEALKRVGLFDERFFMYMEDVDLSRRIHQYFKTSYHPHAHIVHGHARESYKFNKLFIYHMISSIKYFNKWGWFFDRDRNVMNK